MPCGCREVIVGLGGDPGDDALRRGSGGIEAQRGSWEMELW